MFFSAIAGAALLAGSAVAADLPAIEVKGSKFFYSNNGTQFFIRGVAYQQTPTNGDNYIDPLATAADCKRDIPYLTGINTNTIRVYSVDPTANHDECMSALADAGIYVLVDLSAPKNESINQADPSWDTALYSRYMGVIDNMHKYTNVLGFFGGNEVINAVNNTNSAAYVKAVVRDAKAYIKDKNYRSIPVGYAAADDAAIRVQVADYLNCGDESDSIDFFGDNVYEWCDPSTYQTSGYSNIVKNFTSYSVPYFFAEYGCLSPANGRTFKNIPTLFGDQMTEAVNGGLVFEYFQADNNYGLVSLTGNTISKRPDYNNYKTEIVSADPTGTVSSKYSPTNKPAACPTVDASWGSASKLPPTPNEQLCSCMMDTLECVLASSVSSKSFGDLYGQLGSYKVLDGVTGNSTLGEYGAYSMCTDEQKLSFALNAYYSSQSDENKAKACDFKGAATTTSSSSPSGTCSSLLKEAASGTGTVTSSPSGTGGSDSGSGGATSSGLGMPMNAPSSVVVGAWQLVAYIAVAVFSGAGMILL
ncbi:1,3-beta-glucanosyltransferase gel4 [Talaromyces islandicus]|uniref:1,3-beta-glucanosyltransferase n=1 Tax=Talaromyces islandicus TaxID=28573 RepID=A0A0U1M9N0_TALIS|nr:1,3-beta-glucanosyltransferase gel4 [Talaromyces islandicus]